MENNKASHILNTSAKLLGICFLILTSLQVLNVVAKNFIDSIIAIVILFFHKLFSFIHFNEKKTMA